MDGGSLLE